MRQKIALKVWVHARQEDIMYRDIMLVLNKHGYPTDMEKQPRDEDDRTNWIYNSRELSPEVIGDLRKITGVIVEISE
jgi:hypothetical protein